MRPDPGSEKVAVVADALFPQALPGLRAAGYGLMLLPPASARPDTIAGALEQVAEQVAEYRRNGYEVVLVDDGALTAGLTAALGRLGVGPLPAFAGAGQ